MSDRGSYIRAVEAHFLKYRGSGFVLSPKDEALVDSWYRKNIPPQNILRGLDQAVTQMRERENRLHHRPRSISYFARSVEAHTKTFRPNQTSQAKLVEPSERSLVSDLVSSLRALAEGVAATADAQLKEIGERIERTSEDALWELLPSLDSELNAVLLGLMSTSERELMEEQAQATVLRECGPYLSPKAKEEQEVEALANLCREHFGFKGLMTLAIARTSERD